MLLKLRQEKRGYFLNEKFRKYIFYAVGEIALIVVGIFIALEIDNWNSDRREEAALNSYLQSIAGNIRNDLDEIQRLREFRAKVLLQSLQSSFLSFMPQIPIEAVYFYDRVNELIRTKAYFIPNTSGFDAFKNSGILSKLQGRDVEKLLFRYYDIAERIQRLERDLQTAQTTLDSREEMELPEAVENYALYDPSAMAPGRFEELQPFYRSFFQDAARSQDLNIVRSSIPPIVHEYDKLIELGKSFITMIERDSHEFTPAIFETLQKLEHIERGVGNPNVIIDGRLSYGSYEMGLVSQTSIFDPFSPVRADFNYQSARHSEDALHLSYFGNEPWAAFWFATRNLSQLYGRSAADFSRYNQLVLEMKGQSGGEIIQVNLKDMDDPDDGSQTNVQVILTEDWQSYKFDLSEFDNADLEKVSVLSFLIVQEEPLSFAIRTARFVEDLEHE